jgi:hypothetical protein
LSLTSAAVVTVTATADFGRRMESAALSHVAGADANTTMVIGALYVVDGATLTADRTYTLPATAAVGDRIGVMMSAGSASYEVLLTAASGDTLNAVAGGTEWSRLFITGEVVIMRCVAVNATWVVEVDRRIPQQCDIELTTAADGEAANTFTRPTAAASPGAWTARIDNASLATVASDRITVRRAGNFQCVASGRQKDAPADGAYFNVGLYKNAGATLVLLGQDFSSGAAQNPLAANARTLPLVADDYLYYQYRTQAGSLGLIANQAWFGLVEVL